MADSGTRNTGQVAFVASECLNKINIPFNSKSTYVAEILAKGHKDIK